MSYMSKSSKYSKTSIKEVDGLNISYEVKYRDVKYPRLELKTGKLVVILPQDFKNEEELLFKKIDWINKKKKIIDTAIKKISKDKTQNDFLLFGEKFSIEKGVDHPIIDFENKKIKADFSDERQVAKLKNIFKHLLREKINEIVDQYSKKLHVKPNKIYVKHQKTKWASCSTRKNLSFNLKLAALPEEIVRYVVYHEMVHIKRRKHDESFWKIIEKEFKNYNEVENSLLEYWFYLEGMPIYRSEE